MECYNENFLSMIGNRIGKTVRKDTTTNNQARGKFARLCVEDDLEKPLLANYRWDGVPKKIEYEGIHLICFYCGRYGHQKDSCIHIVRPPPVPLETTSKESGDSIPKTAHPAVDNEDDKYGPWMLVTKQRRVVHTNVQKDQDDIQATHVDTNSGERLGKKDEVPKNIHQKPISDIQSNKHSENRKELLHGQSNAQRNGFQKAAR